MVTHTQEKIPTVPKNPISCVVSYTPMLHGHGFTEKIQLTDISKISGCASDTSPLHNKLTRLHKPSMDMIHRRYKTYYQEFPMTSSRSAENILCNPFKHILNHYLEQPNHEKQKQP